MSDNQKSVLQDNTSKILNQKNIRHEKRVSGKDYVTKSGKYIAAKLPPENNVSCKCRYNCKVFSFEHKCKLFEDFYKLTEKQQGSYLMNLIQIGKIQRRRHGQYSEPENSRRQCSVFYSIPDETGTLQQVCKNMFKIIFRISDKRIYNLVTRKKSGECVFKEKRKGRIPKFSDTDRCSIINHIRSIPTEESHYGRSKTSKQYLSPDLNIHRLYKSFKLQHPNSCVTYKYYSKIFKSEFPNLCFHRPRVDTCKICDILECKIKSDTSESNKAKIQKRLHHLKYQAALQEMKKDIANCTLPASDISVISIDLQQVMFVPTLTHSDMFYKRQLSCYNFGIHLSDTNSGFMHVWHEGTASRGADEIASCLFHFLKSGIFYKKKLIIWSDNCAGQNKNRMLVFLIMYLVLNDYFSQITHKFLISGHSFLSCDRDFACIEKRKRVTKAFVPSDLHNIIRSARHQNPFEVIDMDKDGTFYQFQNAADSTICTKKLHISTATAIRATNIMLINEGCIEIKTTNGTLENWIKINVFKKGKTANDIKLIKLTEKTKGISLNKNKKQDLLDMVPYLQDENHKNFYKNLL